MNDFLQTLDNKILFAINHHHTPFLDSIMWGLSDTWIWLPFYILIGVVIYKKTGKKALPLILLVALLIVISDQLASTVIKNIFLRLRPSHNPLIENQLHYVNNYRSGLYGFVSSHSMNVFSFCFYLLFTLGNKARWLLYMVFAWATAVVYSRMYLGVHYPSDVIVPIFLAVPVAWLVSRIYFFIIKKYYVKKSVL